MQKYSRIQTVLLGWVAGIVIVSLIPSTSGGFSLWNLDKVGHFFAYTGLSVLVCLGSRGTRLRLTLLLGAVALGAALEFVQQFVPGRDMSLVDGVFNAAGVLTGIVVFRLFEAEVRRFAGRLSLI